MPAKNPLPFLDFLPIVAPMTMYRLTASTATGHSPSDRLALGLLLLSRF